MKIYLIILGLCSTSALAKPERQWKESTMKSIMTCEVLKISVNKDTLVVVSNECKVTTEASNDKVGNISIK